LLAIIIAAIGKALIISGLMILLRLQKRIMIIMIRKTVLKKAGELLAQIRKE